MYVNATRVDRPEHRDRDAPAVFLREETEFYGTYEWCLDPLPLAQDAIGYLTGEVEKLSVVP